LSYTITGASEMSIKAKSYLVVKRGGAAPTEIHESEAEAIAAAKRLVARDKDEYFVFAPAKVVRPVPVEVEVVDA
jgi:hypothetical protein